MVLVLCGTPPAGGGSSGNVNVDEEGAPSERAYLCRPAYRRMGRDRRLSLRGPSRHLKTARSEMVAMLQFTCETTGRLVTYELPSDATTVRIYGAAFDAQLFALRPCSRICFSARLHSQRAGDPGAGPCGCPSKRRVELCNAARWNTKNSLRQVDRE